MAHTHIERSYDNRNKARRVAILGPCHTRPFEIHLNIANTELPAGMGGYNITHLVLARLANNLATDVITCDPAVSEIMRFEGRLLRLWVVPRRQHGLLRNLYRQERRLLQQAIKESVPDCLHANWTNEYALAAAQAGIPWILSLHDNPAALIRWIGFRQIISFIISLWIMRKSPVITGVSPYVCKFVHYFGGRSASCIPNLIYLPLIEAVKKEKPKNTNSNKIIISVLNWSKFKNTKRGLLAFKQLHSTNPNVQLILVGPELNTGGPAEKWARSHKATQNVKFLGMLTYAACIEHIKDADILFHPALEEAMGCQVAEAMALGIPIVCTRQAKGPAWLINEGQYGNMVDGTSPDNMADGLQAVLDEISLSDNIYNTDAINHINKITNSNDILDQYSRAYSRSIKQLS